MSHFYQIYMDYLDNKANNNHYHNLVYKPFVDRLISYDDNFFAYYLFLHILPFFRIVQFFEYYFDLLPTVFFAIFVSFL